MSEILYVANPALMAAEEQALDSFLAIAEENGLQAHIHRHSTEESNSVKFSVLLFPHLLEPFQRVAWRRTYHWAARHWRLPTRLLGTLFVYQRDKYEFVGATLKTVDAGCYFVAVRISDGWTMQMSLAFLKQTVLPAMSEELGHCGILSIGLGEKERFFQ